MLLRVQIDYDEKASTTRKEGELGLCNCVLANQPLSNVKHATRHSSRFSTPSLRPPPLSHRHLPKMLEKMPGPVTTCPTSAYEGYTHIYQTDAL
jgi:hypothetical protein